LSIVTLTAATVLAGHATPSGTPRVVYLGLLCACALAWLAWTLRAPAGRAGLACLAVLGAAGGLLAVAGDDRDSLAAAFVLGLVAIGAAVQHHAPREAMLVAGLTNGQIADRLVISPATVETHVNRIFTKTGASDRAQAPHYANQHDLVAPSEQP
jgi:DNA-binding CsgD family transcriptional regulator